MNSFVNAVKNTPTAKTKNGDVTFASSGNQFLDLFQLAGKRCAAIEEAFDNAFNEDSRIALRILLWSRDCRGGAGERETARKMLRVFESTLVKMRPQQIHAFLEAVVNVGRWDDLLIFASREINEIVATMFLDAINANDRLAAKWAPHKGNRAEFFRMKWGMSKPEYRRFLSSHSDTVEQKMSARKWSSIIYDHVPSYAGKRYKKAFGRHDNARYVEWIGGLSSGKTKVNASVLYPYDIVGEIPYGQARDATARKLLNAQWDALPDYLAESKERILPMIDTSGSMQDWYFYGGRPTNPAERVKVKARPLDIAISIGLYATMKQASVFKGTVLTWASSPILATLTGKNVVDAVREIHDLYTYAGSTNIDLAFGKILEHAVRYRVPAHEMPTILLVLSDMEFNRATNGYTNTAYKRAKAAFAASGYTLPKVVFWNINFRKDNNPVRFDENGTALVTGFSPSIFKTIASGKIEVMTPIDVMRATLASDRYSVEGVTI